MARVGYFEGTDPILLSMLAAEGVETLPLANMWDQHGKYVSDLKEGEVNVVVGYLHKVIPVEDTRTALLSLMVDSMLSACNAYNIPVILIVPANLREKAKKILGDTKVNIELVAPEELEGRIRKYL